jgi:hypothetical protein
MSRQPTVNSLVNLNKLLREAKQSDEWSLTFHKVSLDGAKIVVYSDSSWANAHEMKSQAGFCVFIAGENVDTVVGDAASLLDWRSHRCWNGCRHFLP